MSNDQTGYTHKYIVKRLDGKPVGRTFTIEIDKDPQANELLRAIANIYVTTRPQLSKELLAITSENPRLTRRKWKNVKPGDRVIIYVDGERSPGELVPPQIETVRTVDCIYPQKHNEGWLWIKYKDDIPPNEWPVFGDNYVRVAKDTREGLE